MTLKEQIREWVQKEMAKKRGGFKTATLASRGVAVFRKNEDAINQAVDEMLRPMIMSVIHREIQSNRRLAQVGHEIIARDSLEGQPVIVERKIKDRFQSWWEYTGTKHVRLMDMTPEDLAHAAHRRAQQVEGNARVILFFDKLAEEMEEGDRVKDVFEAKELAQTWEKQRSPKLGGKNGTIRLKSGPVRLLRS